MEQSDSALESESRLVSGLGNRSPSGSMLASTDEPQPLLADGLGGVTPQMSPTIAKPAGARTVNRHHRQNRRVVLKQRGFNDSWDFTRKSTAGFLIPVALSFSWVIFLVASINILLEAVL